MEIVHLMLVRNVLTFISYLVDNEIYQYTNIPIYVIYHKCKNINVYLDWTGDFFPLTYLANLDNKNKILDRKCDAESHNQMDKSWRMRTTGGSCFKTRYTR